VALPLTQLKRTRGAQFHERASLGKSGGSLYSMRIQALRRPFSEENGTDQNLIAAGWWRQSRANRQRPKATTPTNSMGASTTATVIQRPL